MSNEWRSQNCIARIRWHLPSLPPTERTIAHYVLDNPDAVLSLTMDELAERTHSSYATVNRFCRRLEYAGYRDFQRGILAYLTSEKDLSQMTQSLAVYPESSVSGICANVHRLAKKVLDDSFELIDPATVETVATALVNAGSIGFAGVGASGLIAQYACSRLFRIGLNCHYFIDSTLCRMQAALLKPGDVLFAVSSSGRTTGVVDMAATCRDNGVTVVGLSDFCVTPLSKVCDYSLFTTGRSTDHPVDRDIQFIAGQIAIVDVLYLYCCVLLGDTASAKYSKTTASSDTEKLADKRTTPNKPVR
jgi:RpiR family carbohydrate utilization transcriptional regulator